MFADRQTYRHTHHINTLLHWGKGKGSPYSITERRVPQLIPVLGSQPVGDVSLKPGGMPLFGEQRHDGCEQFS